MNASPDWIAIEQTATRQMIAAVKRVLTGHPGERIYGAMFNNFEGVDWPDLTVGTEETLAQAEAARGASTGQEEGRQDSLRWSGPDLVHTFKPDDAETALAAGVQEHAMASGTFEGWCQISELYGHCFPRAAKRAQAELLREGLVGAHFLAMAVDEAGELVSLSLTQDQLREHFPQHYAAAQEQQRFETARRSWLTLDDAQRSPEARATFDAIVAEVMAGNAQVRGLYGEYPRGFVLDGKSVPAVTVLEYAIKPTPPDEFNAEKAWAFVERMRSLLGWSDIGHPLDEWIAQQLRDPYFVNEGSEFWAPQWVLKSDADPGGLPESFFRFACRIAVGHLKYGPSHAAIGANHIFEWVTALGSDLPARLKLYGTGELPQELAVFRSAAVTAAANDVLATILIDVKEETENAYRAALDYLVRLLTGTDFPRSYAIEFRGPTHLYLPIADLPEKGINQFFACAAAYPGAHPLIERYALAAMRKDEWYTNLSEEDGAMPGTFAVFALGMAGPGHAPLVLDYLHTVDGEHQSMQALFVEAYVDARGFTPEALAYLVACAGNIQDLRHRTAYPALIANRESLAALLALRNSNAAQPTSGISALRANLTGEPIDDYAWRTVLRAIWGDDAVGPDHGRAIIDAAPLSLRPLYEWIFARQPGCGSGNLTV